jgi:hypothetical protein
VRRYRVTNDVLDLWGRDVRLSEEGGRFLLAIMSWNKSSIGVYRRHCDDRGWYREISSIGLSSSLEPWMADAFDHLATPVEVVIDYLIERGPPEIAEVLSGIQIVRDAGKEIRT